MSDLDPDIHDLVAPYALGALDGAERQTFETHLASCERCRSELPGLQSAAAALALDVAAADPPEGLRGRILIAAQAEREPEGKVVPLRRRSWALPAAAGLAAAAACAAVGLGVWAIALSNDLGNEKDSHRGDSRALKILSDPTAQRFPLFGARGSVVVTRTRDAALVVSRLQRAPGGKTYEAWVVHGANPEPAGTFRGGGKQTLVALTMKVPSGAQVSVSLEPAPGSTTLTGTLLFGAQTV